jgi:hypothetical protein
MSAGADPQRVQPNSHVPSPPAPVPPSGGTVQKAVAEHPAPVAFIPQSPAITPAHVAQPTVMHGSEAHPG